MGLGWLVRTLRGTVTSIVSIAPVPQHVAFIMDGNRRYAERQQLQTIQGHSFGYQRLIQALEWCLDLGITCVSVYAFSVDNYKRSEEEVRTLMHLAEEKLRTMLQEFDVLEGHGVQVRVIGDLSLAPLSVQEAAENIATATQHHSKAVLNICFSYTASREMQQALDAAYVSQQQQQDSIHSPIDDYLYTCGCPPVDLLVRTSGEQRLSDFMLRQSSHALLVFTGVLWPDFGFLDLISAVLQYQKKHTTLQASRKAGAASIAQLLQHLRREEQEKSTRAPRLAEQLISLKLPNTARGSRAIEVDSPCSVATPGSGSSPSSRSEGSNRSPIELSPFEDEQVSSAVEDTENHRDALVGVDVAPAAFIISLGTSSITKLRPIN
ncbi:hypothetical protein Ndes2526B_g03342 [Nannochloris sp. 'desiccata']